LYYDFSFCDDIASYESELNVLDSILPNRTLSVANSTSLPFSFALSKSRKVHCYYNNINYLLMMVAFTEERKRFFDAIKSMVPFDDGFLNFALNTQKKIDPWYRAVLDYFLNFYSKSLCSFDGPFLDNENPNLIREHISKILMFPKRKFELYYEQEPEGGILFYEMPNMDQKFRKNSIIITNRVLPDLDLLFEDKLKIYGV
jgi:hypothetical protein